jgi:UDP-4-amino-4,6-dideoxy-N-acetyl-beta-L-altrosamine N-acetyltransferase
VLTLRDIDSRDSERMLAWRNQEDVRRWMYTDHVIGLDEHARWFTSMLQNDAMRYWIIELDAVPVGVIHLTEVSLEHRRCEWGMYLGEESARGTGAAEAATFLSLDTAFGALGMQRVTCEVLAGNDRALRLYERVGFRREGHLRSVVHKGSERHDVVVMGLLQPEWETLRPGILGRLRQPILIDGSSA